MMDPFSYVEKSNRWIYDDLQNIFGRDQYQQVVIVIHQNQEQLFFNYPKQLRISHNFGRVLLDNTEEQERIIEQEKMFTSDKGNLCVFDPSGMDIEEVFVIKELELLYKY